MLSRLSVPPRMITVIHEFHDGMKACVRSSDGTYSEPFEVNKELRQGCALSSLLFNIFIAAVLNVVLQKFSEDEDILAELVHLQEQPRETRPEPPIDCVRRAVWACCTLMTLALYRDHREHSQKLWRLLSTYATRFACRRRTCHR